MTREQARRASAEFEQVIWKTIEAALEDGTEDADGVIVTLEEFIENLHARKEPIR